MTSWRRWTKEEAAYFHGIIGGNHTRAEFAAMMNAKFKTGHFTPMRIKYRLRHEGIVSGYVRKGRRSSSATEFQKGQMSGEANIMHREVGTDAMRADGYLWRKIKDDTAPRTERYKAAHVCVWEEANGPVPEGYVILFLDGDRTNLDIRNLACVSRSTLARLNQNHLCSHDPDVTRAGVQVARLMTQIGARQRE
ncbi:MAG: HNH endonuclease [Clostridiales Family XIII bacterium]|jgi:hypothetical protein|nr:HNH endonuclease [Clostridiales Family XIII bacterium]